MLERLCLEAFLQVVLDSLWSRSWTSINRGIVKIINNYEYTFCDISHICDRIWENKPVSEKNKFLFIALLPLTLPPSKFEANSKLHL